MAARGAAMLGGVMGAVAGMPVGQSQTFAQAGATAGRRIVGNVGQAHQVIAQANQNGMSKPAAGGRVAGALLGGAMGAHAAGAAMAMGSRLLSGAPPAPVNSGNSPAQGGPGVNHSSSQSSHPGIPVQPPPENKPCSGARQTGLQDIIDFNRLTR
jgi:hypothetical protein